ncbi:hypothetical protein NDK43_14355 [Neobacillus pocheonensis]|uniref:Uncharacterized protein n=1 Tax=Neobacillus pocheonensis TaxID=363869 RepID=A0ABT0WAL2_9BACI|nr:hypothetical protein [Neobacillus pocheonensis]
MNENFFGNYKNFIVIPLEQHKVGKKSFDPNDYSSYYILTLSLYDSLILNWIDAKKYEIDVKKSIEKVVDEFNQKQKGNNHLQLLEFEDDKSYFVLALSNKTKIDNQEENGQLSNFIERMISNSFYIGQSWYKLIGHRGRIERKLFNFSIKEYIHEIEYNITK